MHGLSSLIVVLFKPASEQPTDNAEWHSNVKSSRETACFARLGMVRCGEQTEGVADRIASGTSLRPKANPRAFTRGFGNMRVIEAKRRSDPDCILVTSGLLRFARNDG
jgi:hypothetical protein